MFTILILPKNDTKSRVFALTQPSSTAFIRFFFSTKPSYSASLIFSTSRWWLSHPFEKQSSSNWIISPKYRHKKIKKKHSHCLGWIHFFSGNTLPSFGCATSSWRFRIARSGRIIEAIATFPRGLGRTHRPW